MKRAAVRVSLRTLAHTIDTAPEALEYHNRQGMEFAVPIGLGCLAYGLPNVYVGSLQFRGRGIPPQFLGSPVLRLLFTPEMFPRQLRSRPRFEGVMQAGYGMAFAAVGAWLVVGGFVDAFR